MYSVGHNNILIVLMATSFGHNGHHQANVIQNLKMLVHEVQKLSSFMGSHSHQSQYLLCGNKMSTRCNRLFLLQILLLAQHVSGTIMPIIRSSRVLYRWLPPVVFGAWFSSCRYDVELRVVCPVCGLP
jgi:hypothetical protein